MRIRKLGLRRYGLFTDAAIDFGARTDGAPDLHIVYGPNEAGKSTAMSAIMDLLFGIGERSKFNFLHPYSAMRIEADIEQSDETHTLSRIKRPQNSLLDKADQPIPDAVLLGGLGGLDHGTYKTMFCLDDETLEAGGESILASKGDLGQLLFSASAGLADLSQRLDAAKAEADAFFRQGKRSGELVELKKELAGLKEQRDRIDTLASDCARLTTERDDAATNYDEAIARRGRTRARIDEIQMLLNALPRLAALRSLRQDFEPLAGLPEAPEDWATDLPAMMTQETQLATQAQTVAEGIAALTSSLDVLVVDEAACALESRIDVLTDLRARHVTAEKDLPDRRLRLGIAEQTIANILTRIGHGDAMHPERLILASSVTGPLRELMETRSGVDAGVAGTRAEFAKAQEALADAEAKVGEAGGERDEAASRALAAAIAIARNSDDASLVRAANRIQQERADAFADRLLDLRPWQGDRNTLLSLVAPTDDRIEAWALADAEIVRTAAIHEANLDRLTGDAGQLAARIDALGSTAGVVSDRQAGEIRSAREAAWAIHKYALDATTAAAFESAMRRDDLTMEQRFGQTASVAELNRAMLDRADIQAACDQASRQLRDTQARREALTHEIAQAIRAIGGGADEAMGHSGLKLWLQKRNRAIEARGKLIAAERELRQAQDNEAAARARIASALQAAAVQFADSDDVLTWLEAGQTALDRDAEAKGSRQTVEQRRRDLIARQARLDEAMTTERHWQEAWHKACASCWLGDKNEAPAIPIVRETLTAMAELGSAIEKKAELTDRIAKMQRDQSTFQSEVESVAARVNLTSRPLDVLGLYQAIMDSIAGATNALHRRTDDERRLEAEQDKAREIAAELALINARKKQMTQLFGVESLTAVGGCLRKVARKTELSKRLADERREILEILGLETIEDAEAILHALDRTALQAEHEELKRRFDDEDGRSRDMFSLRNKAEDRINAVGGDATVSAINEQRGTVLLAIEDKAITYLRLRLGAAAADKALRAYRDSHRSSMMTRASEAFSLISRGRYSGLASQPMKDSETLIATAADGSSKIASDLSKGTRFQLYLALRVAGYYEFARTHAPAPFLADDIMETFDDFRAEEAFRLLAGMSGVGQVVYFTHHRHLCEIATVVEPRVRIHHL